MKAYKKITDVFVKIISIVLMLLIAGIVGIMLYELCLRNFLNKSFRATTELCGFMFMWMAFFGVIVLYDQDRLITLDVLYVRMNSKIKNISWFINKIFSFGLGVIMVVAYSGMYKINSTSYFSTMQFISKAWHFLPMAITGGFIAVKTIYQILERIISLRSGQAEMKEGTK